MPRRRRRKNKFLAIFRRKKDSKFKKRVKHAQKPRQNFRQRLLEMHDRPNFSVIAIVALFSIGGLLMIFSASAYYAHTDEAVQDTFFYLKRQIIWIAAGSFFSYLVFITPLETLKRYSPIILGISGFLLLYIVPEALFGYTLEDGTTGGLQMPFVDALNGAPRWINLPSFNLQPSELAKFGLVLYISSWLVKQKKYDEGSFSDHFQKVIFPFLVILGAISLMILVQRDFDTTVVIILTVLGVYYVSGTSKMHTLGSISILVTAVFTGLITLFLEGYRRARVEAFLHIAQNGPTSSPDIIQDSGFQVFNGLIGLASGWVTGNGYGQSVIKQGYLQQAAYTDSIFAVIGDEFGLAGTMLVTIGFLYFVSLGLKIARNAKTKFGAYAAVGVTSLIVIQGFLNIAAVVVIIPFGGLPLPFFTYGGSSTIMTLVSVGLLLNVSKSSNQISKKSTGRY